MYRVRSKSTNVGPPSSTAAKKERKDDRTSGTTGGFWGEVCFFPEVGGLGLC